MNTFAVDDHLRLLERSFTDTRLLVFTGMSGSGKSTCIDLLLGEHPDLADLPYSRVGPAPIDWSATTIDTELVVVDELLELPELAHIASLLRRGHRVLAASHLSPLWVRAFGLFWPAEHYRTDDDTAKLITYLDRRGVPASDAAVRRYAAAHGANYTDLEIILEHTGCDDFDRAFARFQQTASIEILR